MKHLLWLRGATAAMTLVLCALLCWQCIDIYVDGNAPENLDGGVYIESVYRAEDVGTRLRGLIFPAAVWAILAGVTAIAGRKAPGEKIGAMPGENRLRVMKRLLPEDIALPEAALREEKLRLFVGIALAAVLLACAIPAGIFLLDGSNFVSWDLETVMAELLIHVLPWAALALAAVWMAEEICARSRMRECAALKPLPKGKLTPVQEKAFPVGAVRIVLLGIAMVFIVLGVMNGGLRDVLVKAINICTECIGLG